MTIIDLNADPRGFLHDAQENSVATLKCIKEGDFETATTYAGLAMQAALAEVERLQAEVRYLRGSDRSYPA